MSRHFMSRGRQPQTSSTRGPRISEQSGSASSSKTKKNVKGGGKYRADPVKQKRKKNPVLYESDSDSSLSDSFSAGDDDEEDGAGDEDEGEAEEPAIQAPSRAVRRQGTGRYHYDQSEDNLSEAGGSDIFPMFEDDGEVKKTIERDEELEALVFASDDEDIYQAVEEVSESDDNDDVIERAEEEFLKAEFELSEDPSFYLNQIDGMSAYGFGDESDELPCLNSSPSSDEAPGSFAGRRVHFEEAAPRALSAFMTLSDSPTMTRALLPSALPDISNSTLTSRRQASNDEDEDDDDDDYDSDATDDNLPPEAYSGDKSKQQPQVEDDGDGTSIDAPQRSLLSKGPPRGTFIDDGDKTTGILDPTGRMLIITDPHLLGQEFARRYGPSAPASPSIGFEEAILAETDSSGASQSGDMVNGQPADPMFSGLTSGANGQVMGGPEAFFPNLPFAAEDYSIALGSLMDGETNGSVLGDWGERPLRIDDLVSLDSDTDDDDNNNNDSPTSPLFNTDELSFLGKDSSLSHLTQNNITAFRRNADPALAARSDELAPLRRGPFTTPKMRRKRKPENDSPYNHSHYKGVTPVQRMTNQISLSSPVPSSKRRRTLTS